MLVVCAGAVTDLNRKPLSKAAFSYNINYKYDRICDII